MSKNEPAGAWVRVSTADQSEASQVPDVERHCDDRKYHIAKRYELNDKSASKGEQQIYQDQVIEDIREGTIKILVCWHSDRVERRGPEALFKFLRRIKDAGGRIESTKEPLLGTEDMSGEAMTAINAVIAHQESVQKSERQKISIAALKASQSVYNNVGWGLDIVGDKYNKTVTPTDLCRNVVPQIFRRCIDGQSLRQIAEWLDQEQVPTARGKDRWNESTVRWIIKNKAYAGRVQTRKGETVAECEAVVSPTMFDKANEALKRRPPRGPAKNRPLLTNLKCARCGSPMYRIKAGSTVKREYYRCFGSGAQRKGCGNMVPLLQTDVTIATRIFMVDTKPHQIREWVEGTSYDDEMRSVRWDIEELAKNPLAEGFLDRMAAKQAELAELVGRETSAGRYKVTDTNQTEGDYFDSLDAEGQREYLRTRDIRVEKVLNPPLEPGASAGIHVIIDGVDYGVFPYPPTSAAGMPRG